MSYVAILEGAGAVANALVEKGLQSVNVSPSFCRRDQNLLCLLRISMAGGVPVALYPPARLGRMAEWKVRTAMMIAAMCRHSHRAPLTSALGRTCSHGETSLRVHDGCLFGGNRDWWTNSVTALL